MADTDAVVALLNGSGNHKAQLITSQTITIVAAIIAVLLRFISRCIKRTSFGLDDWLIVPSLLCALGVYAIYWWMISKGLGQFDGEVTLDKLRTPNLGTWINQILYAVVLSTANISVLALYWRVFRWKSARACCIVIGILRLVWMVVTIVLVCLLCRPIGSAWNFNVAAKECPIDQSRYYLGTGISTMVLDFVTVGLAIALSFRLQMARLDRFLLCIVFASGFFVTAATGVRIKAMMDLDRSPLGLLNPNWTYTSVAIWKGVEINLAVVSACLPCLRPLVTVATQTCLGSKLAKESQYTDITSPRITRPKKRTSGPGIGGVPGAWFRVSRLSTLGMDGVEFGDSKKPQSVHTRHGASEINLPIQDLEGKEIPSMPAASMERPPSWAAGLPIWDGSSGRTRMPVETGRPMNEGMNVRYSVDIESGRESPWPLKD